jgi:peptidoglycan/xylan/chitin deacetylase (PgdA/CDA1 family)
VVALTFDAGANANGVSSIVSTLNKGHIAGTFFLTGNFCTHFPASVTQIATGDYRLGNHSVSHPRFPTLTNAQIDDEILGAERTIIAVSHKSPRPFFRFPYGATDYRSLHEVNRLGYVAVGWTVDTLGWKGTSSGVTVASIVNRVIANLQPGEIVLMHVGSNPTDGSTLDAQALPSLISAIASHGYGFVTMDELLHHPPTP